MEAFGLPKPEFRQVAFILKAIVKNTGFEQQKVDFEGKNLGIEGLKQRMMNIVNEACINASTKANIFAVINEIRINQVFGSTEVQQALSRSETTATLVISKMKSLNLIEPVTGKGKGKYILKKI